MKEIFLNNTFISTANIVPVDGSPIKIGDRVCELQTKQIIAKLSLLELKSIESFDPIDLMKSSLINELLKDTQQEIYLKYLEFGEINRVSRLTKLQKFLEKRLKIKSSYFIGGYSDVDRPLKMLDILFANTSPSFLGKTSFCVIPVELASILADAPSFKSDRDESIPIHSLTYRIGTINNLDIFVNTDLAFSSDQVVIGEYSKGYDGVNLVVGDTEFIETDAFADATMIKNVGITSRLAVFPYNVAEDQYLSLSIVNKKKPLFRKLFNL